MLRGEPPKTPKGISMKINPATGGRVMARSWEDKLSEKDRSEIEMWRVVPQSLTGKLIAILDEIENTQGGQLALIGELKK